MTAMAPLPDRLDPGEHAGGGLQSPSTSAAGVPRRRGRALAALLLFAALLVLYQSNLSVLPEGDTAATEAMPLALLDHGRPSFEPLGFPELFLWKSHAPLVESHDFSVSRWDERLGDRTAREWLESKHLELAGPRYFLVKSPERGTFVSVFGPIPGLLLLPVVAVARLFAVADTMDPALRILLGKTVASTLVAACASLIFLIAEPRVGRRRALLLGFVYGAATCAWAVSSQNLWQQTVTQAFLASAAYFTLEGGSRRVPAALAGLSLGAAAACRPTAALALLIVLAELGRNDRRRALVAFACALPVPLLLLAHNAHYFGSPLTFAQALVGHRIALEKTGSPDLFQTPFLTGALGLLVSPARGLLVHSPVLAPAAWGFVLAFREARFAELRPFAAAALAMMATQCKWFDWWGGHTFGYRPWLDALPYLVLLLVPPLAKPVASASARAAFVAAVVWSVLVQALGAFAYDRSWNLREVHLVEVPGAPRPEVRFGRVAAERFAASRSGRYVGHVRCDVDEQFCRHRLWSLADSPLVYYATHFSRTRSARWPLGFRAWADLE